MTHSSFALTRRSLLLGTAAVAVAPGLLRASSAEPPAPYAGGPLAEVYGRIGTPRGRALGHSASGASGRAVTWLTTGGQETATVVQWGVVPPGTSPGTPPGKVRQGRTLTSTASGSSMLAPGGSFDDDTGTAAPIEGEHPVRVHSAELTGLPPGVEVAER